MCVLDAGCGPGRVTLPAAARVGPSGRVVALDVQAGMLEKLERHLEARGVRNVELVLAGLGEGQLGEGRFDVALLVTVLGEVPEKIPALREIFRALRPGGVLSVTEVLPDPHYQTVSRVRALSAEAGFRESSMQGGWLSYTINLEKPETAGIGSE
jgi:ubiquinone/menaquinone biosynthesis C-methylase UbiE